MIIPETYPTRSYGLLLVLRGKFSGQYGKSVGTCIPYTARNELQILLLLSGHIVDMVQFRIELAAAAPNQHRYGNQDDYR